MKIFFDMPFITLNEYINSERTNRYKAANIKAQQTNSVSMLATRIKPLNNYPYDVVFRWFKPTNKQDHDNIAFAKKFILDGLIKANVIENDSPKYINNFRDEFILDRKLKYIVCEVEFIELI